MQMLGRLPRLRTLVLRVLLPVVVVELLQLPLWVLNDYLEFHFFWFSDWLPIAALVITGVCIPIFLCFTGIIYGRQTNFRDTFLIALFLACCFLVGMFLDYANWGITSKMFFRPDFETALVFEAIGLFGLGIMAVVFAGTMTIRFVSWHLRQRNASALRPD